MVRLERGGGSFWVLPGGAIEAGESAEEAAVREVAEETGLDVRLERLLFVEGPGMAGGIEIKQPRYTYLARDTGGELRPDYGEVAEVAWLPLDWDGFDSATRATLALVQRALQSAS